MFDIVFTERGYEDYEKIKSNKTYQKRYKAVRKAIEYLRNNPRHPSLNTHKYKSITGNNGEEIFEAYAENNTAGAYRVFWHYGPENKQITIIAITEHP